MKLSLYEKLYEYIKINRVSFHTPGHKGISMFNQDMIKFDLTELEETDDLYNPKGAILQSEIKMQELFGTKRTIFSAGGNTLCIQTMIALSVPIGGKILISRNVHKSVISTLALLDITPIWVNNENSYNEYIPGPVDCDDIDKKLEANRYVKAVLITSPDYYGTISDIGKISCICKKHGVTLIVDNAHGSHLKFTKKNLHPISLGADMSADSLHKTMPVMTGGAVLHISNKKFIEKSKSTMGLFGSTSPSYPIMASIDLCREWLCKYGKESYSYVEDRVNKIKDIAYQKGIEYNKIMCDPTRITLNVASIGYTGLEFKLYLNEKGIEPEFYDDTNIVLIPSPFNTESDWEKLEKAIFNIEVKDKINFNRVELKIPKMEISIRKALFSDYEVIGVINSKNRVAAEMICPCPPGIPLVIPGELIDDYTRDILINYRINNIKVVK